MGVGRNLYFDSAKTRSEVSKDISDYEVCVGMGEGWSVRTLGAARLGRIEQLGKVAMDAKKRISRSTAYRTRAVRRVGLHPQRHQMQQHPFW